eukprot:scaffold478_cov235-Chaetoceros_neogracile.AAC.5
MGSNYQTVVLLGHEEPFLTFLLFLLSGPWSVLGVLVPLLSTPAPIHHAYNKSLHVLTSNNSFTSVIEQPSTSMRAK